MSTHKNYVEITGQCENSEGDVYDFTVEIEVDVYYDRGDYYNPSSFDVEFVKYTSEISVQLDDGTISLSDLEFDKSFKVLKFDRSTGKFVNYPEIYLWVIDQMEKIDYDYSYGSYSDSEEYYRDDEF